MSVLAPTGPSPEHAEPAVGPAVHGHPRRAGVWAGPVRSVVVVIAMLAIAVAHGVNVNGWPVFGDDEGTYVAQAWAVLRGDLAHYTYWYDHPPAGWIQLAAVQWLPSVFGASPTVASSRIVMVAVALVTALLVRKLSRNLGLSEIAAVAAMLLWGLNPLVVYEARQVLLDNLSLPWLIGALVLVTSSRRNLAYQLAGGVCFGVAVLTKETVLVLAPVFLLALWTYSYRPTRAFAMTGVCVILGLTGSVYPLFAMLRGELVPGPGHVSLIDGVWFQLVDRTGSGVMWDAGSPARGVVASWFRYDAILPTLGAAAGLCCLCWRRVRPIGVALSILVVMALRPNGYLPAMFVIVALPFAAIAVAAVVDRVGRRASSRRSGRHPVGRVAVLVGATVAVALLAAAWMPRQAQAWTTQANEGYSSALAFVAAALPRSSTIVVDDAYWTDLVAAGWDSDGWHGAIWHYKLDLDPIAAARELPGGWRDVDFLIESETVRLSMQSPDAVQLRAAHDHSLVVAEWGTGESRVVLREVHPEMDTTTPAAR